MNMKHQSSKVNGRNIKYPEQKVQILQYDLW